MSLLLKFMTCADSRPGSQNAIAFLGKDKSKMNMIWPCHDAGATSSAMKAKGGWFKAERLSAIASGIAIIMGLFIATGGTVSLPFLSHSH